MTAEIFDRAASLTAQIEALGDYGQFVTENFNDLRDYNEFMRVLQDDDNPTSLRFRALRMAAILRCIAVETNAVWQLQQRKLEFQNEFQNL